MLSAWNAMSWADMCVTCFWSGRRRTSMWLSWGVAFVWPKN